MTDESRRRPPHPSPAEARPPPSPSAMPVCTRLTPVLNFSENRLILWGCVGAWQEVRFLAFRFCGCVGTWQEVRFVASSSCGCVGT